MDFLVSVSLSIDSGILLLPRVAAEEIWTKLHIYQLFAQVLEYIGKGFMAG